jgi:hypothetical protein
MYLDMIPKATTAHVISNWAMHGFESCKIHSVLLRVALLSYKAVLNYIIPLCLLLD